MKSNSYIHFAISILTFFFIFSNGCKKPQIADNENIIQLNNNWIFYKQGSKDKFPAKVPGNIHSDLINNNLIDDPFWGTNEIDYQWISNEIWIYETTFDLSEFDESFDNQLLIFEGLDTHSEIYLNDSAVLSTNNMFRNWQINATNFLRKGKNTLKIVFTPPHIATENNWKSLPYELAGGQKVMSRKAGFHFGWDWGATFITSGIWRPAYLKFYNSFTCTDFYIQQDNISSHKAELQAVIEIESDKIVDVEINIFSETNRVISEKANLQKGYNCIKLPFTIKKPNLWWIKELGEAYLYEFQLHITDNVYKTEKKLKTGLRKIELITKNDSIGQSFGFQLNGVPIFIKGANYIPQDNFQNRCNKATYEKLINSVSMANMNMLRVWGGGIYEEDIFYELCDEKGILVWQDFMFACAMYPADSSFIESVENEAVYNIKRLRNHPSIALWCGNNEISEAWHNWGWTNNLAKEDSAQIWNGYKELFMNRLPQAVNKLHSSVAYWESSPKFGRGNKRSLVEGDSHYWGVWHDAEDFKVLEQKVPRFMSEFGFQSFPEMRTIDSFCPADQQFLESKIMLQHQKHPRGNQLILTYLEREFPIPDDFSKFVYLSQVTQAEGIGRGIEAHRRAKPVCMGTMYWQLNDCWPVASWSSIDYYGRWKALHYRVSENYKPIIISLAKNEKQIDIYVVSDIQTDKFGIVEYFIMNFDGNLLFSDFVPIEIKANKALIIKSLKIDSLLNNIDIENCFLRAALKLENGIESADYHFFTEFKHLKLKKAEPECIIAYENNTWKMKLKSNKPMFFVEISSNLKSEYQFSDNFFHLIPNEEKVVFIKVNSNVEMSEKNFSFRTLVDCFYN